MKTIYASIFRIFSKVSEEELEEIENLVNQSIEENISLVERRAVSMDTAKELGAMALFGEKYGDKVRVISIRSIG
jgi:alanyl-tRNA synthetase